MPGCLQLATRLPPDLCLLLARFLLPACLVASSKLPGSLMLAWSLGSLLLACCLAASSGELAPGGIRVTGWLPPAWWPLAASSWLAVWVSPAACSYSLCFVLAWLADFRRSASTELLSSGLLFMHCRRNGKFQIVAEMENSRFPPKWKIPNSCFGIFHSLSMNFSSRCG